MKTRWIINIPTSNRLLYVTIFLCPATDISAVTPSKEGKGGGVLLLKETWHNNTVVAAELQK